MISTLTTENSSGLLEVDFTNKAIGALKLFFFRLKIDHFESNQKPFHHKLLKLYRKHALVNNRIALNLPPSWSDILKIK